MIDLARKVTSTNPGSKAEFINAREDDRNYRVPPEKIRRLLGSECRYYVDERIALLADWVRENRPNYQGPAHHNQMYRNYSAPMTALPTPKTA